MYPSLLDVPISFFEYDQKRNTFANVPSQTTTLRRIVTTRYYQASTEAIQAETDEAKQAEMKKHQPAITPVSLLHHRKRDTTNAEKIAQQWPMLMGDVDRKDNPGLNMDILKAFVSSLPYVLVCAFSVRRGVWFMVRLPEEQSPETLAAHHRYLLKLFSEKFKIGQHGIKLDSTKGGNPTDLRFVSFDNEPYLNDAATVMSGTYTPKPPKRQQPVYYSTSTQDEGTLLQRIVRYTQQAGEGERHSRLLKAARTAGGYVAIGNIDEQNAILALETIASEWPDFNKSSKTIRDGIRHGKLSPHTVDNWQSNQMSWKTKTIKPNQYAKSVESVPVTDAYIDESWQPYDYTVESKPSRSEPPKSEENHHIQETLPLVGENPFRLPVVLERKWQMFSCPPLCYNIRAAHKALLRWLEPNEPKQVVTTIAEQIANPCSILRPTEAQLERLAVEPVDNYPADWDEPSPAGAVPTIKSMNFFEWQRNFPPLNQLGLASCHKKNQA